MGSSAIQRGANAELARRSFFDYCRVTTPSFYKQEREYLIELADNFQEFYETDDHDVLIVNVPPRHGKSLSATHFAQWVFGINPSEKIMTGSYNETLSTVFSKQVRNGIQEEKAQLDQIVYNDIFPDTKIKQGDGAMNLWSLEGEYNNYLATSPTGTATGFGASLLIIDDLIKNAEEAFNANTLDKHWQWFTNTMLSRLEANGKIIIIMTRWHSDDLAGRALKELPEKGFRVKHVSMKALQKDGTMLCDDILNKKQYLQRSSTMGAEIVEANYNQEPMDVKGRLYTSFKTYDSILRDKTGEPLFERIASYTDTADTGKDFLCSVVYGVYDQEAYILDAYYTKAPMEETEPAVVKMFHVNNVDVADIESNNGGRGFARTIERLLKQDYKSNKTKIEWFHQSKNKEARILSNSTWVMDHIYFPTNWRIKWPKFHEDVTTYSKEGKNKHDDAPDTLTGIAEKVVGNKVNIQFFKGW
ncbi:MAG: phage terminase large subunit [Alkalibacterium sp.]|nr:phage terminase large subunit [Alkalibacterium sp.]